MKIADKKILVVGLGKSGHELIAFLNRKISGILAFDADRANKGNYRAEDYPNVSFYFGENPTGDEPVDLVLLSPGIPLELDFVQKFISRGIEIIGEVELAYRLTKGRFVGITGTNGKTTTTALVGEIFKNAGFDTRIVGNIGNPIIAEIESATEDTVFVAELSSFQLETTSALTCHSAAIINVTPDHLDRHKTIENYANCKLKVFQNQTEDDVAVINVEDALSYNSAKNLSGSKVFVSTNQSLHASGYENYLFLKDNHIVGRYEKDTFVLMSLSEVYLKGKHNYENVLCAIGLSLAFGIDKEVIAQTLRDFKGVAHRLEMVEEINGVTYVNDSKGTNPDASIKALEAIEKDIILIAGGYDKKSNFDEFVSSFEGRVKYAIILGATKPQLKESFAKFNFENYIEVEDMVQAVERASEIAREGDTVLLSPACASWGMYDNFEQRGEHFKSLVRALR